MGLFSSIFDTIGDGVTDLFGGDSSTDPTNISSGVANALGKTAITGAGLLLAGSSSPTVAANTDAGLLRATRLTSALDQGVLPGYNSTTTQLQPHTRDETQGTTGVDADTIEGEWNGRLRNYANFTRIAKGEE